MRTFVAVNYDYHGLKIRQPSLRMHPIVPNFDDIKYLLSEEACFVILSYLMTSAKNQGVSGDLTWYECCGKKGHAYPISVYFNDGRVCACELAPKRGHCGRAKRGEGDSSHPGRSSAPIGRVGASGCSER